MHIKSYSKYWDGLYFDHVGKSHPEPRGFEPTRYHMHEDRYELYYLHTGDITQIINGKSHKLKPRDLVLTPPGSYHCVTVDSSAAYEHFVIVFNPKVIGEDCMRHWPETEIISCQQMPVITEIFRKLDHYYTMIQNDELKDVVTMLTKEILYNIGYSRQVKHTARGETLHPLVAKAVAEINANLFTISNIDEIAEKLFVTRGYLYRMFKQEMNTTPLRYITERRLDTARNMLLQGASPTQVYLQCGFSDYTTFYRNYIKAFGQPPSA